MLKMFTVKYYCDIMQLNNITTSINQSLISGIGANLSGAIFTKYH